MGYLEQLRAQATRLYAGVAPLTQALVAGEAAIAVPGVPSIYPPLADQGAPIAMNTPGVHDRPGGRRRHHEGREAPERGPAVRLLPAHPGGQAQLNADPGSISPWDLATAAKGYIRVDSNVSQKSAQDIYAAFGVEVDPWRYRSGSGSDEAVAQGAPPPHAVLGLLSARRRSFIAAIAIYPLATVLVRIFYTDGQLDLIGPAANARRARGSPRSSRTR